MKAQSGAASLIDSRESRGQGLVFSLTRLAFLATGCSVPPAPCRRCGVSASRATGAARRPAPACTVPPLHPCRFMVKPSAGPERRSGGQRQSRHQRLGRWRHGPDHSPRQQRHSGGSVTDGGCEVPISSRGWLALTWLLLPRQDRAGDRERRRTGPPSEGRESGGRRRIFARRGSPGEKVRPGAEASSALAFC